MSINDPLQWSKHGDLADGGPNFVILSEVVCLRSGQTAQSKDPYTLIRCRQDGRSRCSS
jgi:hypothetical protein